MFVTGGSAKIINNGYLAGRKYGVLIAAGGTITNQQDGTITGQTAGVSIDLHNFSLAGAIFDYNAPSGLLQITNSAHQFATLDFQASTLAGGTFHLGTDGSSGVLITRS